MYSCGDFVDDVLAAAVKHGWIKEEDIPNDKPEEQADLLLAAMAKYAAPVRVVIGIEGGLVSGSSVDRQEGVEIILLDYDVEGALKSDGVHDDVPQSGTTKTTSAFARDECPNVDRKWVSRVFDWLERVSAAEAETVVPVGTKP